MARISLPGRCLILAALTFGSSSAALAEPPKGGDAGLAQTLRKAQGMLRQLSQEKADLEAKVQALEAQVKTLEPRAAALDTQLKASQASYDSLVRTAKAEKTTLERDKAGLLRDKTALEAETRQLKEGVATQKAYIEEQRAQLQAAAEQQQNLATELEKNRDDNRLLVNAVKERTRWIQDCTGRNRTLVQTQRELLQKFADEGVFDRFKATEPLTGLGRVAKENAVQDFEFKLEDLEVTPWQDTPPAP